MENFPAENVLEIFLNSSEKNMELSENFPGSWHY